MKKRKMGIFLFGISLLLWNCTLDENTLAPEKVDFGKVKTVSFKDAIAHFNSKIEKIQKRNVYFRSAENNVKIIPDWSTLKHSEIAYTEAELTTADSEINRNGDYSSELCFINVNNHLKNVILTVWKDEIDSEGNVINGRIYFNDLEGMFLDGYTIEDGIFTKRYVVEKSIKKAVFLPFFFFQSTTNEEDDCWNMDTLGEFDGGVLGEVVISAPGRENGDVNGDEGSGGSGYGDYVNAAVSWNPMRTGRGVGGGGGGRLSFGQINSAAAAILMAAPVRPDKDGECPEGYVFNPTTEECDPTCKTEGRLYNSATKKCECPKGMVEDSTRKCVKKPCKGDPVANVEIAPQLGASGIQGALHDTCARFNEKYTCKGVRGRKWHNGVDLKNPYGAPVFAMYNGTARLATQYKDGVIDGAGYHVFITSNIDGNEVRNVYFHLQKDKRVSGTVKAGDIIGYQGLSGNLGNAIEQNSTTSHVRIKTSVNGIKADPLDYLATTIDPNTRKITNPYN